MPHERPTNWKLALLLGVGAVLCLAQAASVDPGAAVPQMSVAVLPFLDLTTQSMDQEYFADGLTEELIDDLSRTPGLKVPSATASFYFKGKQMTVAHIAHELGVAYVVDGSLRKADATLRVAARLVRADNGFVVWSGTYDTQSDNVLSIQGDVAAQVTQALQGTLRGLPPSTRHEQ
jgi:transcriptional activator of cad operon